MQIILPKIGTSLFASLAMFWEIFWALVLGFLLSSMVMVFVPKKKIASALGKPSLKSMGLAAFLGSISSSCSYAAASMARSLFQKGAHIIPALAFMLASTNLVIELSTILWIMMGWQFVVAEFVGGFILLFIMALLMRFFAPLKAFEQKQRQLAAQGRGAHTQSDTHASIKTRAGWEAVSRTFFSEWKMIGKDIVIGVVISGFLMVLVPDSFWQSLFLQNNTDPVNSIHAVQLIENALVGPLVSVVSFVCSVGNIPLASVLYHGGITFGGAISFIYADLIIIPMILVYRRYYGWRLALWIAGLFYISIVATGIIVDVLFKWLGWVPERHVMGEMQHMHFFQVNYTFWLNLVFAGICVGLAVLSRASKKSDEAPDCCHS